MLDTWLKPVDKESLKQPNQVDFDHILFLHDSPEEVSKAKLGIIGIDEDHSNAIRRQFYSLRSQKLPLMDFGNLRKAKPGFATQLIGHLISSHIIPIFIGGDSSFFPALFNGYQFNERMVNIATIDKTIAFNLASNDKKNYLNSIFNPVHPNLFHYNNLATQAHFTDSRLFQMIEDHYFESFPLGKLKRDIQLAEPILRDADMVSFNLDAIRCSDYPSQNGFPVGLSAEEACQLARFAGISDKLSSFGIFGEFNADNDISSKMAALTLWYFLDGYADRKNEYPVSKKGLKKYVVFQKSFDYEIIFWKSPKSGRWWMQVPVLKKDLPKRHLLVPCSYQDYLQATKEILPERLINSINRMG